jgi:arylsulfatase A-like enzyme
MNGSPIRRRRRNPTVASRRPAGRGFCLSILWSCLLTAGCPGPAPPAPACRDLRWDGPRPGANVILVINDTMRRDRMGTYGGPARTPAFDALAGQGLLFHQAYSQSPWTKPSVATLMTSQYPSQHRVLSHPEIRKGEAGDFLQVDRLDESLVTMAEVFRSAGYRTAAFVANPWLTRRMGFEQGFDRYDDSFASWEAPGELITDSGLEWLDDSADERPFFLVLHYMDTHRPYPLLSEAQIEGRRAEIEADSRPLAPYEAKAIGELVYVEPGHPAVNDGLPPNRALLELAYDSGIERFDRALAALLEGLEEHPAFPETAIVVTSDHGEALFTRGYDNHGNGLYDDEAAVPLAARLPGVDSSEVECLTGLIDLLPTLCGYLDMPCPPSTFGTNLFSPEGSLDGRYLVTEGVIRRPDSRSIRDRTHKLIRQPGKGPDGKESALFDVAADPGETDDLLTDPNMTHEARLRLDELTQRLLVAVPPFDGTEGEPVPLSPEEAERLRSLGYLD